MRRTKRESRQWKVEKGRRERDEVMEVGWDKRGVSVVEVKGSHP